MPSAYRAERSSDPVVERFPRRERTRITTAARTSTPTIPSTQKPTASPEESTGSATGVSTGSTVCAAVADGAGDGWVVGSASVLVVTVKENSPEVGWPSLETI